MRRAATLALLGVLCACGPAAGISVEDAWVRTPPPGVAVLAGYLTVHNPTGRTVAVVGVRSDAFGRAEIHATVNLGGIIAMRRIERLEIPAGGDLRLEPGGRHLMLMDPRRSYRAGERLGIVLVFADGLEQEFVAEVRDDAS